MTISSSSIRATADANAVADLLGVSPPYKREANRRWSNALRTYKEMKERLDGGNISTGSSSPLSNASPTSYGSSIINPTANPAFLPETNHQSPAAVSVAHIFYPELSSRTSPLLNQATTNPTVIHPSSAALKQQEERQRTNAMLVAPPHSLMSKQAAVTTSSGLGGSSSSISGSNVGSPGERNQSTLELEAVEAVHELSSAVTAITVSDMLPRTPHLIFVNVTTLEGQAFCLELTMKGWRVTSLRHDSMNGDINSIDLHTRYFGSPFKLMEWISPAYRSVFPQSLSRRLEALQQQSSTTSNLINDKSSENVLLSETPTTKNSLSSVQRQTPPQQQQSSSTQRNAKSMS